MSFSSGLRIRGKARSRILELVGYQFPNWNEDDHSKPSILIVDVSRTPIPSAFHIVTYTTLHVPSKLGLAMVLALDVLIVVVCIKFQTKN